MALSAYTVMLLADDYAAVLGNQRSTFSVNSQSSTSSSVPPVRGASSVRKGVPAKATERPDALGKLPPIPSVRAPAKHTSAVAVQYHGAQLVAKLVATGFSIYHNHNEKHMDWSGYSFSVVHPNQCVDYCIERRQTDGVLRFGRCRTRAGSTDLAKQARAVFGHVLRVVTCSVCSSPLTHRLPHQCEAVHTPNCARSQNNGHDCGVFALRTMQCEAFGWVCYHSQPPQPQQRCQLWRVMIDAHNYARIGFGAMFMQCLACLVHVASVCTASATRLM